MQPSPVIEVFEFVFPRTTTTMQPTTALDGTFRQRCPVGQPMSVYIRADIPYVHWAHAQNI
jgi:hypothetical protein